MKMTMMMMMMMTMMMMTMMMMMMVVGARRGWKFIYLINVRVNQGVI
jgi:hypothetical protein